MKTKKMFSKVLAAALAVLMLVGLMPVFASASSYTDEGSYSDGPVALKKTATLEDDGTYTINLEAFTTGQIKTVVEKTNKPTDIVLVIDQSGSMANTMAGLPSGQYSEVTSLTNAQAYAGTYYYDVDGVKYPVTVKYATVGEVEYYVDIEGKQYLENQVEWKWTSPVNSSIELDAYGPYLESSLVTFTRHEAGTIGKYYYYTGSDGWEGEHGVLNRTNAFQARQKVRDAYTTKTLQFDNNSTTGYIAAAYTQLTPVYAHTYEYYYTNADGDLVALSAIGTGNDTQCPHTLYQVGTTSSERLNVLTYALENFVASVEADAKTNGIEHRIAIVGFANSKGDTENNTEILTGVTITPSTGIPVNSTNYYPDGVGHNGVQYDADGYDAATGTALQSAITDAGKANIQDAIDALTADGGTYANLGLQMAEDILSARTDKTRDSVVVFFTDGAPGSSSFDKEVAAETIKIAKELKNGYKCGSITVDSEGAVIDYSQPLGYSSSVYAIAVVDGADPYGTANIQGSGATQINEFMHMVSSNYPQARGENQGYRGWEFFREQGSMTAGYYMVADNAAGLANVFKTITNNIHQTQAEIDLGSAAILRDILADGFTANEAQVTVKKVPYQGNGTWGTASDITSSVKIDKTDPKIEVTGYDYNANVVTEIAKDDGSYGAKLAVTIKGILAKDGAVTGTDIFTNTAESGIYGTAKDSEGNVVQEEALIEAFARPTTSIGKKTYVLDYAKAATFSDVITTATGVDDASDLILNSSTEWANPTAAKYGELSIVDGKSVYTPKTMQWDGYDNFYVFGKNEASANAWTKVSVLPANNVYYEDTFITNTAANIVGITYDGNWSEVKTGDNAEDANGGVHGWVEDLADDTGDSDGTNHSSTKLGATATFTFTGTGFDVYSRTNMYSGMVYAKITWKEINSEGVEVTRNKGLYVNTESVSGEYYNIPTLWFNGDYSTYTVTISVESAPVTNDGTTYSYCIDGIRIYNPIGDNIDDTVAGAYGDELAAYFESLRDFLLDAENLIDDSTTPDVDESTEIKGAVFIDKVENEVGVASNQIAVYEDYGPKNEVYLAKGQSIAFNVGEGVTSVQIGLKAPQESTNALVSFVDDTGKPAQGDITVGHTTDLFYTVTPDAKGNVIIKNNGEGLLSITKIKWLAIQETSFALTSTDALLLAADEFDTMPVVAYSLRASAPETEDSTDPETPVEPEQPAEPESPVEPETPTEPEEPTEPSGPNVEIENPEVPEEPQQPDIEAVQEQIKQFVTSLFNAFRGWFGRQ